MVSPTSRGLPIRNNSKFTNEEEAGIWAHAYEDTDRTDGYFNALYTWLRLGTGGA